VPATTLKTATLLFLDLIAVGEGSAVATWSITASSLRAQVWRHHWRYSNLAVFIAVHIHSLSDNMHVQRIASIFMQISCSVGVSRMNDSGESSKVLRRRTHASSRDVMREINDVCGDSFFLTTVREWH
jgi:hypothetical protein